MLAEDVQLSPIGLLAGGAQSAVQPLAAADPSVAPQPGDWQAVLLAALPVLAMLTGGWTALTDRDGRRIRVVDAAGQDVPELEGKVFSVARRAAREGRPVTGPSELARGASVWAFPLGTSILVCTDIGKVEQERGQEEALAEVLPRVARALGRQIWAFDALGRIVRSSDPDGTESDRLVGSIDGHAYEAMAERRPVVAASPLLPGATSVYLPLTRRTGLQVAGRVITQPALASLAAADAARAALSGIVGSSPALQQALQMVRLAADSGSPVLILGETGTGKEVFARAIHALSSQRDGPFVTVACGALPGDLVEATLFGRPAPVPGSAGAFAEARGGTLFLDEISELPGSLQARLLHVLGNGGATQGFGGQSAGEGPVRLVASSSSSVARRVQSGRFRRDLYYRLNVYEIEIPPLRDRREDIPLLLSHFIDHFSQLSGRQVEGFTGMALEALAAHHWPGNVRELKNCVERAVGQAYHGPVDLAHLPAYMRERTDCIPAAGPSLQAARRRTELETIVRMLEETGQNRAEAARRLGISTTTLWRKLSRLGDGKREKADAD